MARKPDIQYIHEFYSYGSEALQVAPKMHPKKQKVQAKAPEKQIQVLIDPASVCGIVVAVTMLVLMAVGMGHFSRAYRECRAMEERVLTLQNENISLQREFKGGYDILEVEEQALAMGMVPVEQAQTITITGQIPQPEPEPTFWENMQWFFEELFA